MRLRRTGFGLVVLLAQAAVASGQEGGRGAPPVSADRDSVVSIDTLASDAVSMPAMPRDFVLIRVPVPATLPAATNLAYSVEPQAGINVLSRRRGTLTVGERRQVVVTVGVPADARAGELHAATVTFVAAGIRAATVPVLIDVTAVRGLAILAPPQVTNVRAGDRVNVGIRVRNDGNIADTVQVSLAQPPGWDAANATAEVVVLPGRTAEHFISLSVPAGSATGDFFATARVHRDGAVEAEAVITVQVGARLLRESAPPGPVISSGFSLVSVDGEGTVGNLHLQASGPLTAVYNVDARASLAPDNISAAAVRGLARVGSYVTTPYITIRSESSRYALGNVLGTLGDLSGVNAAGRGASAELELDGSAIHAVVAKPLGLPGARNEGLILGGRYARDVHAVRVAASGSVLRSGFDPNQRLASMAVEASSDIMSWADLTGGVAWRSYRDGAGAGAMIGARHHSDTRNIELRAVHAPGGGRAFARARDELSITATQRLSERSDAGGGIYFAGDENSAFSDVTTNTLSIYHQYRILPLTSLRIEARTTSFDARGESIGFGNGEHTMIASVNASTGSLFYSAQASIARAWRTISAPDLGDITSSGPRTTLRAIGGYSASNGVIQAEASIDRSDESTGFLPQQLTIGASLDRFRIPYIAPQVFVNASAMHYDWGTTRDPVTILRGSASVPLNHHIELVAGFERNPLYRTARGTADWSFSFRVDKRITLPRLAHGTIAGNVYNDVNGNGVRDDGESGIAGVSVRMGDHRAVSESDGNYYFWSAGHSSQPVLDPATLPRGLIAGVPEGRGTRFDLPAVPVSQVEVTLGFAPGPFGTVPDVDVSKLPVIARDQNNREFIGRRSGPRTAVFDALPVGNYTLDFEFAAIEEPLRIEKPVLFRAEAGPPVRITVELAGRPLRFRRDGGDSVQPDSIR